jgi:hypothetical protein
MSAVIAFPRRLGEAVTLRLEESLNASASFRLGLAVQDLAKARNRNRRLQFGLILTSPPP